MPKPVILASTSPRRRELLKQIGLNFSIDPADVDETMRAGEKPAAYAVRVALDKARVAAARAGTGVVIAADTIVVLGTEVLGKPADSRDAVRMLSLLSGREHRVITGFALIDAASGKTTTGHEDTSVRFRKLTPAEIDAYVGSGEPLDKAGAYGIQEKGAMLVDGIEGCYFNVVGLPLSRIAVSLRDFGIVLL